ncbi:MAG: bifunctional glutamate N-acetyltransferase/amino-acid acetyltransferase ArgJ [Rhodobacteraceae bacterium]|nr:bifunctional glutamate N-acetyltransferase/amino-acid acetyltransferase ArgJ [Paracoccaceae bacterium]
MADITAVSPLAPASFPDLPKVAGVTFATAAVGVKYQGRTDVMLACLAAGTTVAGVFTKSTTRAAPVLDCQAKLPGSDTGPAAILVNSGNANAFTGANGIESVNAIVDAVAQASGCDPSRVFTSSTGVIGEKLPHDRVVSAIDDLVTKQSNAEIEAAARAIMTTDTYAKGASRVFETPDGPVTIAGMAKGSGMIAPDMATMLVYIFTDACIAQTALQQMVSDHCDTTFNAITVDSDTSTSDSLIVAATGASGINVDGSSAFADALYEVMQELAHLVVKDGEGAHKFVQIDVTGAVSTASAKTHAMAIANSPLVKTAIAGEDPNWGRVVMAIGKSGAEADRDKVSIWFGDVLVAENGWVSPTYVEDEAAAHMKGEDIRIRVDLGLADGAFTAWTCDLTHAYIDINADYRS